MPYFIFQEYIDAHPETIILDPLPAIRTLLDRSKSYELIRQIEAYMQGKPLAFSFELDGICVFREVGEMFETWSRLLPAFVCSWQVLPK